MSLLLFAVLAALSVFAVADSAQNGVPPPPPAAKAETTVMQLTVNVPASMRPWVSDNIAETFADRVSDALRRQGCKNTVRYLDSLETPDPGQPILAINLIEWRTDHAGSVDCTFTATVLTAQGKKNLGMFTGTSMMLMFPRHDWISRSDQFDDAASQALSNLYRRIKETHLLPE